MAPAHLRLGTVGGVSAPFIAIDGEAAEGDYTLLACSDGRTLTDLAPEGLHTHMCLEFLLRTPKPAVPVCFGLNYDVNNWLRDLPRHTLKALWETHVCYWRSFRIEWVPGRWFSIGDTDGRRVKVHEVFGFFQTSFVKALEDWSIGQPAEISRMKGQRGDFKRADIDPVTRYCLKECELLVTLMDALRGACEDSGVVPRSWIGAGATAMALLSKHVDYDHHAYDLDLASEQVVEDAVLGAYYAGRIELLRQGVYHHVKTADLRSAYPAAATALPSLDGARLINRKRFDPGKHGVWRVEWKFDSHPSPLLAPFPVRQKHRIHYPLAGSGWYHTIEVATAIELGYPVDVKEGWILKGGSDAQPFDWIPAVYKERAKLKTAGAPAEKVLKLALNSCYGKLAQGYGFNSRPKWQCYLWAGEITAATRARMLRAAVAVTDPLMISTDGIFCRGLPHSIRDSAELGRWEIGDVDELFTAQAGVYQGITPERTYVKSRGFYAREVDYDQLREGWESEGHRYTHIYDSRRFIGLGVALMRKDFGVWRKWVDEKRAIHLSPERKGIQADCLTPPAGPLDSEPYVPKLSLTDQKALDQMQGMDQPLKESM